MNYSCTSIKYISTTTVKMPVKFVKTSGQIAAVGSSKLLYSMVSGPLGRFDASSHRPASFRTCSSFSDRFFNAYFSALEYLNEMFRKHLLSSCYAKFRNSPANSVRPAFEDYGILFCTQQKSPGNAYIVRAFQTTSSFLYRRDTLPLSAEQGFSVLLILLPAKMEDQFLRRCRKGNAAGDPEVHDTGGKREHIRK